MREIIIPDSQFITLLEAFDHVGRRLNGIGWTGHEAEAIRLGQRGKADPETRRRGLEALDAMMCLIQNGTIAVIYTDQFRNRVSYFQTSGPWLTAIYPDPVGTGEGQIELDDRNLHSCIMDVSTLKKWRPVTKAKTGPKRKHGAFEAACLEFFRRHSTNLANGSAWQFAKDTIALSEDWPSKSYGNSIINEARACQKALDRPVANSGLIPDGLL